MIGEHNTKLIFFIFIFILGFNQRKKNYISIIESHQDRKYLSKSENDISSSIELHGIYIWNE